MAIELRDYQQETVDKVVARYKENPHGHAKFVWATGLGKTVGFSAIAHEIRKYSSTNVLIIAHREELLEQAIEKYQMIDPTAIIGQVGAGRHEWGASVTVASIQTISRPSHLKQAQYFNYGLIIIDECHHVWSGNKYGKVLAAFPDAFKLGVTATDMRLDKRSNFSLFGLPVVTYGIRWGINQGHLCNLRCQAIATDVVLDGIDCTRNENGEVDWNEVELGRVIDTPLRNQKIVEAYLQYANNRRTIGFGVTIAHAEHLTEAFLTAGIPSAVVTGDTSKDERKCLYKALSEGAIKVLWSVQVLTEGFDSPKVSCIIMARPTQSESLFLQIIGRGLRTAPAKADCLLLDITDNCYNHSLEPQSLSKVLKLRLLDNETVLEAEKREASAHAEKQAVVRRLDASHKKDLDINLLEVLAWQERTDGFFVLEFGSEQHRIALVPSKEKENYYSVWARLFPDFVPQRWLEDQPLSWAQQFAEREIKKMLADPKAARWADRNHPARKDPMSEKQRGFLKHKKISLIDEETGEEVTKGQASELIDQWYQKREAKEARQQEKERMRA